MRMRMTRVHKEGFSSRMCRVEEELLPVVLVFATAGKGLVMVGMTPIDTCLCREGTPLLPLDAVDEDDSAVAPPVVVSWGDSVMYPYMRLSGMNVCYKKCTDRG